MCVRVEFLPFLSQADPRHLPIERERQRESRGLVRGRWGGAKHQLIVPSAVRRRRGGRRGRRPRSVAEGRAPALGSHSFARPTTPRALCNISLISFNLLSYFSNTLLIFNYRRWFFIEYAKICKLNYIFYRVHIFQLPAVCSKKIIFFSCCKIRGYSKKQV